MKKLLSVVFSLVLPLAAWAQESSQPRHQLRVGWGDPLFETLAFHPSPDYSVGTRIHDCSFTGHIFCGYSYRLGKVVSVGGELDFEGIFWQETVYGADYKPAGPTKAIRNYNLVAMPEVSFSYLDKPSLEMHSGLGVGALLAFDNYSGKPEFAPAFNLNLFGLRGGGTLPMGVDIGFLVALKPNGTVYMLGSRLVSISVNYRF